MRTLRAFLCVLALPVAACVATPTAPEACKSTEPLPYQRWLHENPGRGVNDLGRAAILAVCRDRAVIDAGGAHGIWVGMTLAAKSDRGIHTHLILIETVQEHYAFGRVVFHCTPHRLRRGLEHASYVDVGLPRAGNRDATPQARVPAPGRAKVPAPPVPVPSALPQRQATDSADWDGLGRVTMLAGDEVLVLDIGRRHGLRVGEDIEVLSGPPDNQGTVLLAHAQVMEVSSEQSEVRVRRKVIGSRLDEQGIVCRARLDAGVAPMPMAPHALGPWRSPERNFATAYVGQVHAIMEKEGVGTHLLVRFDGDTIPAVGAHLAIPRVRGNFRPVVRFVREFYVDDRSENGVEELGCVVTWVDGDNRPARGDPVYLALD